MGALTALYDIRAFVEKQLHCLGSAVSYCKTKGCGIILTFLVDLCSAIKEFFHGFHITIHRRSMKWRIHPSWSWRGSCTPRQQGQ